MDIDLSLNFDIPTVKLELPHLEQFGVSISILRLDLIHPSISGNKWFKLKEYLNDFREGKIKGIVTFGGAFSNHLNATAAACLSENIPSVGFVRGQEGILNPSQTLKDCKNWGMDLWFLNRKDYAKKDDLDFIAALENEFPGYAIVPEGGDSEKGRKGAMSIADFIPENAEIICVPVGTGTTICGVVNSKKPQQQIIGFVPMKGGDYMNSAIAENCSNLGWSLISDYHFGGFGKYTPELLEFIREFKKTHNIELDFVYTAKMLFGILKEIEKGQWQNKQILCIHTGGLQGNRSIEHLFS